MWGGLLRLIGIKSLVLLLHEGGQQTPPNSPPTGCANFTGPVDARSSAGPAARVRHRGLRPHAPVLHLPLPNRHGQPVVVTSAGSNGQLVTDIDFTLDKRTRRFAEISGVENGSDRWRRRPPTRHWSTRRPRRSPTSTAPRWRRSPTGSSDRSARPITRTPTAAQESPLGDVIADAQLAWTQSAGAQIALMNPGGIRADLRSSGGEARPGHLRRGVHGPAVQQPGGHPDLHRGTAQGGAGAAVRRLRRADHPADPADLGRLHLHLRHDPGRRRPRAQHAAGRHARSTRRRPTG